MERLFQPLLFFLARCSCNQLIRQIEFLRAENEILRKRLPKIRIRITLDERMRLIKFGTAVGPGLHKLITIVAPAPIAVGSATSITTFPRNEPAGPEHQRQFAS